MALLADAIRFRKPSGDFVIDLVGVREAKGMKMIPRRKSFDPAEAWILQAPRQDNVTVHPVLSNHERRKTHPDLKRDPRLLR